MLKNPVFRYHGIRACAVSQFLSICALLCTAWSPTTVLADQYDPPANYYSTATGTGATLRMNLHNIISTMTPISYGDDRYAFPTTDADPAHPGNILLVYTQESISSDWGTGTQSGKNYSREHMAPVSWLGTGDPSNTYKGLESDLFELRPINQSVNSTRGNNAYGARTANGLDGSTTNGFWYPGDWDAGEVARSMFYMATRYYDGSGTPSLTNLSLVAGQPANGSFQIGDLPSLLAANYKFGIDTFERNRNQVIYSGWNNALTGVFQKQGNRNPYIDHPEYVWAIFGTGPNTSQISVATPAANGSSSATMNLGRVIAGSSFISQSITVNKTGATPTTFNVTTTGTAASTLAGTGETFDYNAGSKSMSVGLASSAIAGPQSGTVVVHNSDLTTAATGQGSADGDDVVNVSGTAVDHSNASFSLASDVNHLTINFGALNQNTGIHTTSFSIGDLLSASGYTAGLDLDSITGTGNTSQLFTNLATFSALTAGTANSYLADINTSTAGAYSAEYMLAVSDENITGATANTSLVLDITGTVVTGPQNLFWSGNSSAWDIATSSNWNSGSTKFNAGDTVTFDDSNTGSFTVTTNTTVQPASVTINGSQAYILNGTGGIANQPSGTTTLTQTGTGSLTISTVNTYTGATTIGTGSDSPTLNLTSSGKIASSVLLVNAGATANINGLLTGTPALTVNGTVTLGINDGVNGTTGVELIRRVGALNVGVTGNLNLTAITDHGSRTVLVAASLTNAGKIDVSDNDLVIENTSADTLFTQLQTGRNGGAYWNGTSGIISTSAANDTQYLTTLGYRQSDGTSFDGTNPTTADALVKYTYYGDADLNGTLNGADYAQIDNGFGLQLTGWYNGDFNYDGVIDGTDYALLDNTFNQIAATNANPLAIIASPSALIAAEAVPEPTTFALLGIGTIALLSWRRGK